MVRAASDLTMPGRTSVTLGNSDWYTVVIALILTNADLEDSVVHDRCIYLARQIMKQCPGILQRDIEACQPHLTP